MEFTQICVKLKYIIRTDHYQKQTLRGWLVGDLKTFVEQLRQYDPHMFVGDTNADILDKNIGNKDHKYLDIL